MTDKTLVERFMELRRIVENSGKLWIAALPKDDAQEFDALRRLIDTYTRIEILQYIRSGYTDAQILETLAKPADIRKEIFQRLYREWRDDRAVH